MKPAKVILNFIPFAAFTILANWIPTGWAAAVGAFAAIVVVLLGFPHGIKALPAVQFVILTGFTVLGFSAGPFAQTLLHTYGRGLVALTLSVYILATAQFAPFTVQFAKTMVPSTMWKSDRFLRINRRLSFAWGMTVLAIAICHLVSGAMEANKVSAPIVALSLNWGVPVIAILVMLNYSKRIPQQNTSSGSAGA